jgi:thiamine-monophosphate kinase
MPEPGSEFERIAALVSGLPAGEGVVVGVGDDAAVLRPREGRDLVATTDAFVEARHFRRDLLTPAEAGTRLGAANLSDLAAMAAEPRWALLSLVVPRSWTQAECQLFERACARALAADGAAIVGGNLASGEGAFSATLTLLGEVERGRAWTRGGARPGDLLAVTGAPGSAAAFLALCLRGDPPSRSRAPHEIAERVVAPASRVKLARALSLAGGVRAAIDISDGLAADLSRVCDASGVGVRVFEASLPADPALEAAARAISAFAGQERGPDRRVDRDPAAGEGALLTRLQLGASDDYEILLSIEASKWPDCERVARELEVPLVHIGEFTGGNARVLVTSAGAESPLDAPGWDHFKERG